MGIREVSSKQNKTGEKELSPHLHEHFQWKTFSRGHHGSGIQLVCGGKVFLENKKPVNYLTYSLICDEMYSVC